MHLTTIAFIAAIAIAPTVPPTHASEPDSRQLARLDGQGVIDADLEGRFDRALSTIDRHCAESRVPVRGESSIADIVLSAARRLQQHRRNTPLITFAEAWALAVEGFPPTGARQCVDVAAALVVTIEDSH